MKTKIYTLIALLMVSGALLAQNNFWKDVTESSFQSSENRRIVPKSYRTLSLDTIALKQFLAKAPFEFSEAAKRLDHILMVPLPNGGFSRFAIVESPAMEPALAAKFPNIKTYGGQGIDDRTATIKIDWTEFGFHAMIISPANGQQFVDPYSQGNKTDYIAYSRTDLSPKQFVEEGVEIPTREEVANTALRPMAGVCVGNNLRTYRLALACTGEYASFFGGTLAGAMSGMVTTMNRVNGVYESEVAIRMVMVANNDLLIYTNSTTDPYTNNSGSTMLGQNQTTVTNTIGSANYDIGHVFSTGGGGIAALGSVCNSSQKARGVTGSPQPTGDAFDIDYVAHEMGHQFSGNHSFNAITGGGGCNSGTRNPSTSVEPGGGVTIMAYAGICGSADIASNSIPYFHAASFNEIGVYRTSGDGATCGTLTNTQNTPPVVIDAGGNKTIPKGTPFVLSGSAVDANGDALTYSWEEIDPGTSGNVWNSGSKPYFRSFPPTITGKRYFPRMQALSTGNTSIGEMLPPTGQNLNFRLTARDNRAGGGGVCFSDITLTVSGTAGPFTVISQWGPETWTANGTNVQAITWDKANTDIAPVNATAVDILFSVDGGLTYPYVLKSNTPNDGSENIVVPAVTTTNGRVMVKARDNVFFAINDAAITVQVSSCAAEGATVSPANEVTATAGSSSLNLNLTPQYSGGAFSASGSITSTDAVGNTAVATTSGSCITATSGGYRHDAYSFKVTVSGTYTFFHNGAFGIVTNIYTNSFNPSSACTNFVASNGSYNGTNVILGSSVSAALTAGTTYVLTVGSYNSANPALPAAYNVTINTPAGGAVQAASGGYTNPGAGFSYSYVIVNNITNTIVAISNSSNLSNGATYASGSYSVYGVSYATANAATLNSYVGQNFNNLTSAMIANPSAFCANLSKNGVMVNISAVAPVGFLGLKATKLDNKVKLDWGTSFEQNSDRFIVERSNNGTEFTAIETLKAAGNSNITLYYSALDNAPANGTNYYRIKEVDVDGETMYSNVVAVTFGKSATSVMLYPNPATDRLTIEMNSNRQQKVAIQIIDSKGAIMTQQATEMITGVNKQQMNVVNLPQGIYVVKIVDAEGNTTFSKFIKQ